MSIPVYKFEEEATVDPDEEFIQTFVTNQQHGERHSGKQTPIVIDNGSYRLRAGYSSKDSPSVDFPQLVGRPKNKREGDYVLVGDQIKRVGNNRLRVRTQFDQDVVYQFELMEYVLDYTFGTLGIEDEFVDHPIVITETICNPTIARRHMSELLFECYSVPSVCYGVDDLFSLYYNQQAGYMPQPVLESRLASQSFCWDSLIVSSGFWNSFVIPYVGGTARLDLCNRISVGGYQSVDALLRQLGLRYPQHRSVLTIERAQEILYKYSYVAEDYSEELAKIEMNKNSNALIVQLPYKKFEQPKRKTEDELAELRNKRRANGYRLQQMATKRRQEKQKENQSLLDDYEALREMRQMGAITYDQYISKIIQGGFESEQDFNETYLSLRSKVRNHTDSHHSDDPQPEQDLYPLIHVPDNQLSPDQIKEKKHQKMRKAAAEARARKKLEKDRQKLLEEQEALLMEEKFSENPDTFRADLHRQRQEMIQKRERRMKTRADSRRRKSNAARKKMKILAEMGTGKLDEKFGTDDSHWDVYRQIGADDSDDEDKERSELDEIDALIAKYDPESVMESNEHRYPKDEDYQLSLTVDRIRTPELLFQPPIIGCDQGGLGDTISRVLNRLDESMRLKLVKNVFVTGGNTAFPRLRDRLTSEIRRLMPFQAEINVSMASDVVLDAWKGACLFANSPYLFQYSISREEYLENGGDYFKEHAFSNVRHATPHAQVSGHGHASRQHRAAPEISSSSSSSKRSSRRKRPAQAQTDDYEYDDMEDEEY